MSLQVPELVHLSQLINSFALIIAFAGGWLLLATRWRERLAIARLRAAGDAQTESDDTALLDEPTARLNRVFYRVGFTSLGLAVAVSYGSRLF